MAATQLAGQTDWFGRRRPRARWYYAFSKMIKHGHDAVARSEHVETASRTFVRYSPYRILLWRAGVTRKRPGIQLRSAHLRGQTIPFAGPRHPSNDLERPASRAQCAIVASRSTTPSPYLNRSMSELAGQRSRSESPTASEPCQYRTLTAFSSEARSGVLSAAVALLSWLAKPPMKPIASVTRSISVRRANQGERGAALQRASGSTYRPGAHGKT
jgi:hypothetical protein